MRKIEIPICERSRKYGYIYWTKKMEEQVQKFWGNREKVAMVFDGREMGEKRIDWKYRRIYFSKLVTKNLGPEMVAFKLTQGGGRKIKVSCV